MSGYILDPACWPGALRVYVACGGIRLAGVHVGGCVDGGRFRRQAHAHTGGASNGWICYLSETKRLDDDGLAKHELAHLISGEGHTDRFRAALAELHGGVLPREEMRAPRQSSWHCRAKYHGACFGKSDSRRWPGRCKCPCHRRAS